MSVVIVHCSSGSSSCSCCSSLIAVDNDTSSNDSVTASRSHHIRDSYITPALRGTASDKPASRLQKPEHRQVYMAGLPSVHVSCVNHSGYEIIDAVSKTPTTSLFV